MDILLEASSPVASREYFICQITAGGFCAAGSYRIPMPLGLLHAPAHILPGSSWLTGMLRQLQRLYGHVMVP